LLKALEARINIRSNMQTLFKYINEIRVQLVKYHGQVDLSCRHLKTDRDKKVRIMYNKLEQKIVIPVAATTVPSHVVKQLDTWAKDVMCVSPREMFIRSNINYEGKKDSTIEKQKSEINKIYWYAKEIVNVDNQFLSTRPLAASISLTSTDRGRGIRISPFPVTTMPLWIRDSCYPIKGFNDFFYFDVATAEFANLLIHVNKKKYKEIYFDGDLYDWISSELSLSSLYSRTQIKQVSMALICGATYAAVMSILKISEEAAKVVVSKFWGTIPDVHDYLEDLFIKVKLSGSTSIDLMDNYTSEHLVSNKFNFNNIEVKRMFWASFIRDSFMTRFGSLLKNLFNKTNRKLCFAWVDSCLIPIQDKYSCTKILKDIKKYYAFPLKIKYQVGSTWGEAANGKRSKILIVDN